MSGPEQSWARLRCIACHATYDIREIRYRCDCGDLLEVHLDLDRIRHEHGDLKARFDERLATRTGPYASGVWRFHEMVLPDLPAANYGKRGQRKRSAIY